MPRSGRHSTASRRGDLEGIGEDAAEADLIEQTGKMRIVQDIYEPTLDLANAISRSIATKAHYDLLPDLRTV